MVSIIPNSHVAPTMTAIVWIIPSMLFFLSVSVTFYLAISLQNMRISPRGCLVSLRVSWEVFSFRMSIGSSGLEDLDSAIFLSFLASFSYVPLGWLRFGGLGLLVSEGAGRSRTLDSLPDFDSIPP